MRYSGSEMLELLDAAFMATAFKFRGKEGVDDRGYVCSLHVVCRQAEHVRVVVLPGHLGISRIAHQCMPGSADSDWP